jgi:hypothetical protein
MAEYRFVLRCGLDIQAGSGFKGAGKSGRVRIQEDWKIRQSQDSGRMGIPAEWRFLWNVVGDPLMIS